MKLFVIYILIVWPLIGYTQHIKQKFTYRATDLSFRADSLVLESIELFNKKGKLKSKVEYGLKNLDIATTDTIYIETTQGVLVPKIRYIIPESNKSIGRKYTYFYSHNGKLVKVRMIDYVQGNHKTKSTTSVIKYYYRHLDDTFITVSDGDTCNCVKYFQLNDKRETCEKNFLNQIIVDTMHKIVELPIKTPGDSFCVKNYYNTDMKITMSQYFNNDQLASLSYYEYNSHMIDYEYMYNKNGERQIVTKWLYDKNGHVVSIIAYGSYGVEVVKYTYTYYN